MLIFEDSMEIGALRLKFDSESLGLQALSGKDLRRRPILSSGIDFLHVLHKKVKIRAELFFISSVY